VLIDWFTVAAQVVNFLVLVYLLKRFLYGPIIRAMDERERKIASRMEEAEDRRQEAEREAQAYLKKNAEFDARREAMLSRAGEEADARRKALVSEARSQADALRANWFEAVQREKEAFLQDLRQRTSKHVCAIARRALKDLSNAKLEDRMIQVFIDRIQKLDEEEKKALEEAVLRSGHMIDIHSSFKIPQKMGQKILENLKKRISDRVEARFEISPDSICGIELRAHGHKVAWSVEDYLQTLEESLTDAFDSVAGVAVTEGTSAGGGDTLEEVERERASSKGTEEGHGTA
jgi:F-type H+-transporting ATPase subunit b